MGEQLQKLNLNIGQTVRMTAKMQTAVHMLQLTGQTLEAYIQTFLEQNPLLEMEGGLNDTLSLDTLPPVSDEERMTQDVFEGRDERRMTPPDQTSALDATLAATHSHLDDLVLQLQLKTTDPLHRKVGEYMIFTLDPTGYFFEDTTQIARMFRVPLDTVQSTLYLLKTFEPLGVFSTSVAEFLRRQLEAKNKLSPLHIKLLDNINLLETHDLQKLQKACDISFEVLKHLILDLRALKPRPFWGMDVGENIHMHPDIVIRKVGHDYIIHLNPKTAPKLGINQDYYQSIMSRPLTSRDKTYMRQSMSEASWLIKALEQRAHTLYGVAESIVTRQKSFFDYGLKYLQPMTLQDIANDLGLHESTISRVVADKFMETPIGSFPFKYFFKSAIKADVAKEGRSSTYVKSRIKSLIADEKPDAPLSDQQLAEWLKREGIQIARRTVMKYREAEKIPDSLTRRRQKLLDSFDAP